eukprot:EG_transcript_13704
MFPFTSKVPTIARQGSRAGAPNSLRGNGATSLMKTAVLEYLLNASRGGGKADSCCWVFRCAAQLQWDRISFLRSFGHEVPITKILRFCQLHMAQCPAAEKPECAIKTLAFMVELVEAGIIPAEVLWDFLSACLEGLTEDKTDQLNVMLTLASSKQGACATWDRVLELMQSRLEANLGIVFGSESPKSDGTCCSEEGFTDEAISWDTTSQTLASVVNSVLEDDTPSSNEGSSQHSSSVSSHKAVHPGPIAAHKGSEYSLFELPSIFDNAALLSSVSSPGTAPPSKAEPWGVSKVRRWNETAMANARVAAKDKHLALQKLQAAVEDNERLKQQLAEAQKITATQREEKRKLTKELHFARYSAVALSEIHDQLQHQLQVLQERQHYLLSGSFRKVPVQVNTPDPMLIPMAFTSVPRLQTHW